jgi:ABC-type nitrate/sulfonate/bicarbonate transport system substrate-binding protein
MKKTVLFSVIVLFIIGLVGAIAFYPNDKNNSENLTSITFATHKIPLAAPYIIAKEKNLFSKYGLDVEMVYLTTGLETLHALTSKNAQFASTGVTPFVHFSFQRQDVKIINQVTLADDFQLIARLDSGISNLEDLKNKKIGYVKGTVTQLAIVDTLKQVDIEPGEYELVELNQPLSLPSALQNKDLDAFCAWEPFISNTAKAIGLENVIVFGKDKGLHALPYLTMATNSFLENPSNLDIIIAFQKALIESVEYIHQNSSESISIIASVTGMDKEQLEKNWNKYTFDISLEKVLLDELELEKEWFDSEQNINYMDLIESKYLQQANE